MKTGIVFEGGAFRTIFFLRCYGCIFRSGYYAGYMIGVSAGAAYGVSYASRQKRMCAGASQMITLYLFSNTESAYQTIDDPQSIPAENKSNCIRVDTLAQ